MNHSFHLHSCAIRFSCTIWNSVRWTVRWIFPLFPKQCQGGLHRQKIPLPPGNMWTMKEFLNLRRTNMITMDHKSQRRTLPKFSLVFLVKWGQKAWRLRFHDNLRPCTREASKKPFLIDFLATLQHKTLTHKPSIHSILNMYSQGHCFLRRPSILICLTLRQWENG